MPSGLARRAFQAFELLERISERQQLEPVTADIRGPWLGYVPDVEPSLLTYQAMALGSQDLVARGEYLVVDVGWSRVDPDNLPLGEDEAAWGTGVAGADRPQAVNHLDLFIRTPAQSADEIVALTADMGRNASEQSHIFKLASGGTWTDVPPNADGLPGADLNFGPLTHPHSITWPTGIPGSSVSSPNAAATALNVEPIHIIAAPGNNVAFWPSWDLDPGYPLVEEYDQLIARGEGAGNPIGFQARTLALFEDRVCYLNTIEGGAAHPRRMTYSIVGDPTDLQGVGAGSIDALETDGEGIRLEPMGDLLVGYFRNAINFYRRTNFVLAPFEIEYLNKNVSLLGTHAMIPVSEGLHFGIFEEGWFFLDQAGNLFEAGLLALGSRASSGLTASARHGVPSGGHVRRWHKTFYRLLSQANQSQTQIAWDTTYRAIRVSFVSVNSDDSRPDVVWLYDPEDDRVWPMSDYEAMRVSSYVRAPRVIAPALPWTAVTTPWSSTPGAWLDYAAQTGSQSIYHGTDGGYVVVQDGQKQAAREQEDGMDVNPMPLYVSHLIPIEGPGEWKEVDRFEAEVRNDGLGNNVSLTLRADDQTLTLSRPLSDWPVDNYGSAYMTARLPGTHLGFDFSGGSPGSLSVAGFRLRYIHRKGEVVR